MKKTKAKSPNGGASRQAKFREEQRKLGRRGRLYYLTDAEKKAVDSFLQELRELTREFLVAELGIKA